MGALLPLVGRFGPLRHQARQQTNVVKKESRGRTSPAKPDLRRSEIATVVRPALAGRTVRAAMLHSSSGDGDAADWLFGMELCGLARPLLSRRSAGLAMAGAIRVELRYGRSQQHVLPAAGGVHVRGLALSDTVTLRDGGEGKPLSYAPQEVERAGRTRRAFVRAVQPPRLKARAGPLPASRQLSSRSRAARVVSAGAAAAPAAEWRATAAHAFAT